MSLPIPAADEELVRRLPLPLAQLYRRAHNAKAPLERHLAAFYLWEASLKLLAAVAVVEYAHHGEPDPQLTERLRHLARPSLGHWWEFARRLLPLLAERDADFGKLRDLLLGASRDDLPRAAGLDAVLREALDGQAGARSTVRLSELFDRLVRYRNQELGHGAASQRPADVHDRLGAALLAGTAEVLGRLDVLAGRRLLYVGEVRQAAGQWLVQRYELVGESARRVESLALPLEVADRLPTAERVYLEPPGTGAAPLPMHPLLLYEADGGESFFLNARRGRQRVESLCYTTGRTLDRADLGDGQRALLSRVLGLAVDEARIEQWTAQSHADEPSVEKAEAAPRRQLGEFELLSELGRGGMGVVYRAWQPSLGRQVALKCLYQTGDPKAEARFRREIRALGRVEHPHLVQVYTSGADGDQWFYAMDLVEGASLAAVLTRLAAGGSSAATLDVQTWCSAVTTAAAEVRQAEKPLSDPGDKRPPFPSRSGPAEAVSGPRLAGRDYVRHVAEVIRQVAEAAHALHEAGIVHRDITPGNIIVTADGSQAVLMDLGLAQLADEEQGRLTRTRQFVGTLRYASPQQVLSVGRLDRRADVYGLGATLWEVLTLRPLYGATEETPTPELMERIQRQEPERPRKYNPGVPRDLEAVVLKCLEKDPPRRYGTAQELAEDLGLFLAGEPVRARAAGAWERGWKWARRRPAIVALAGVSVAAVVGLIVMGGVAYFQVRAALREEAAQRGQAEEQLLRFHVDSGAQLLDEGDFLGSLPWFAEALRLDRRGPDHAARHRARLASILRQCPELAQVWLCPQPARYAEFSPDGRRVVTAAGTSAQVWDLATGAPLGPPLQHARGVWVARFSPNGRLVVTAGEDGAARVWVADTGAAAGPAFQHQRPVLQVAFDPEGKRVVTASSDHSARVWDTDTGEAISPPLMHARAVASAAFSPDGRQVVTASLDGTAQVWDAVTGQRTGPPLTHGKAVYHAEFDASGRLVVTASEDRTARLWDARTGGRLGPPMGHEDGVLQASFSPDGGRVVTVSQDQTARLWDTTAGHPLAPPLEHRHSVHHAAFSPDGLRLLTVSADQTARLWDAMTGEPVGPPWHQGQEILHAAFSPDGQSVLTSDADRAVRLWRVAAGGTTGPPLRHDREVNRVAFSPDGARLATASDDQTARIWQTDTGRPATPPLGHGGVVGHVEFSPDGRRLVTASDDQTACVWDAATGERLLVLRGHAGWIFHATFSRDGRYLATASKDRTARLWSATTGRLLHQLGEVVPPASPAAPSPASVIMPRAEPIPPPREPARRIPDEKDDQARITCNPLLLASTSRLSDPVEAFFVSAEKPGPGPDHHGPPQLVAQLTIPEAPVEQPAPIRPFQIESYGGVWAAVFSPDGSLVLTVGSDNQVRIWEVKTGRLFRTLEHTGPVFRADFRPDGRQVVTASRDQAQVWDTATGQPFSPPLKHLGSVYRAVFSPDGRLVATASSNRTARLWAADTGKPWTPPLRHGRFVHHIAFSPAGERLLTVGTDQARVWDVARGNR